MLADPTASTSLDLPGLRERVELRVHVVVLVLLAPAPGRAPVDEARAVALGSDLLADRSHRLGVLVVVEDHLHLHAATVRSDERLRDRHPVEGVDRDPDRRAPRRVLDRVDDLPLDAEPALPAARVVEERTLWRLPPLAIGGRRPSPTHTTRLRRRRRPSDRGSCGGDRRQWSAHDQAQGEQDQQPRHELAFPTATVGGVVTLGPRRATRCHGRGQGMSTGPAASAGPVPSMG